MFYFTNNEYNNYTNVLIVDLKFNFRASGTSVLRNAKF